jgi:uncharacterized protein YegJ (DUF2314 family)
MNILPLVRPFARTVLAVALAACSLAVAAQAQPAERNTRHALIIGIGQYNDPEVPPLLGVKHDMDSARRMARAMAVPDANMRVLRDSEATADRIRQELTALQQRMNDGDRLFVYFSGHGTRWFDEGTRKDDCTEGLLAADGKALTNVELGERLAPITRKAEKVLVFYDACFSGGVASEPFRTRSLTLGASRVTPKFTRAGAPEACAKPSNFRTRSLDSQMTASRALPQNVVHIAASRPDEVSFDNSASGGFATTAWRDCLLGQATDRDGSGAVTVDEITACAQARVNKGLEGQPGISGQQMTVAGNRSFVPAWMSAAFSPAKPPAPVAAPAPLAAPAAAPTAVATAPVAAPSPAPAPTRIATPAEILTELHAQRDGARTVTASARQPRMKIGQDLLQLDITAARDGHLYIALAGSDGKSLYLIFPNDLAKDNVVKAGQKISLPAKDWEVVAGGPAGTETLLVMVTDAPRDLSGLAQEKAGPFMKSLLDGEGRSRLQQVLSNGTPAAGCGQPGKAPCSDAFGAALLRVQSVN